jgi:hypothetical protein
VISDRKGGLRSDLRAWKVGMLVGLEVFAGSHCVGDVEASFVLGRVFKAPGKPPPEVLFQGPGSCWE